MVFHCSVTNVLSFSISFQTSFWLFTAIALLLNFIITFGSLFYFEACFYSHIHRRDLIENPFCLSDMCVYKKGIVCLSILHQGIAAESKLITCLYWLMLFICTVFVPLLYIPFCGLCCRWELIFAVCSQLALVSRVWEHTGKVCREVYIWCGRRERGVFGVLSSLAWPSFPHCFSHQSGQEVPNKPSLVKKIIWFPLGQIFPLAQHVRGSI